MACASRPGEKSVHFIIGQKVTLLNQEGDTVYFKCTGDYFSASSCHFTTELNWEDIRHAVIEERNKKISINKAKKQETKKKDKNGQYRKFGYY